MKRIIIIFTFILFGIPVKNSYAAIITTPCPDDEGGGKYNHCRPESRGCEAAFEINRDGAGNTNQECTDKLYPSGAQKAICCQIKPLASYTSSVGTCPTIRSDGNLNYCIPGGSCGSYSSTSTADNAACSDYLYSGGSPASCCKSPFTVPVGSASGSSKITGKFYLDANGDDAFNTGDSLLDNQLVSLATGQSDTTDASGEYELNDVPLGGNTITFKFDKDGNIAELKSSISVIGGSMVYDFPLTLDKVGGGSGGGGGTPSTPSAGVDVKSIIDKVSESKIREYMTKLVDDDSTATVDQTQTRLTGTTGNATEANYIKSHFESLGLTTTLQPFSAGGVITNNVVATLPGTSSEVYFITSHMDSISPGGSAPGADDNGSGTVLVMEAARVLKESGITPKKTIKFVTFSGEEQNLLGSKYYIANTTETILGVANVDMIGTPSSSSECIVAKYGEGGLGSAIASKIVDINNTYSIGLSVTSKFEVDNRSDHWPFQARGKQAAFMHECTFSSVYHSVNDKMEYISFSQVTKVTKAVTGAIATLANE